MKSPRITKRERGLLKGALRRVFSRSELRRQVIQAAEVQHSDPKRPRVKKWCLCNVCKKPEAKSYCVVDHIDPVVPTYTTFEEMGLDKTADRLWCHVSNLQCICPPCHNEKNKRERKARRSKKNEQ